jgi:hypothetical protein
MPEPPSASQWELADRAYQAHHFQCPQCIAAGVTRSQPRCEAGAALWGAYQQERDPRQKEQGGLNVRKPLPHR